MRVPGDGVVLGAACELGERRDAHPCLLDRRVEDGVREIFAVAAELLLAGLDERIELMESACTEVSPAFRLGGEGDALLLELAPRDVPPGRIAPGRARRPRRGFGVAVGGRELVAGQGTRARQVLSMKIMGSSKWRAGRRCRWRRTRRRRPAPPTHGQNRRLIHGPAMPLAALPGWSRLGVTAVTRRTL